MGLLPASEAMLALATWEVGDLYRMSRDRIAANSVRMPLLEHCNERN